MDGIVEEGDAAAEEAANDFGDYQTEGGRDGPAEDRGAQSGVGVAEVAMSVAVTAVGVA